jgi:hypothetical protein
MGLLPRFIQGQTANSLLAHTTIPFPQAYKSLPWLTRPELCVTSTFFKKISCSFLRQLSETTDTIRDRFIRISTQSGRSPSPDRVQLLLSSCLISWPLTNTTAICCSYKTLKMLSCCKKDLQIHLTCTGESGAEHSRHLTQPFGVWSGLQGADWHTEAGVKEHHWHIPWTTGQPAYGQV